MPRPPRLHVEGGFYHVILRGNHREPIFFCAADRDGFASLVGEVIERFRVHHALERRIATMSTLARHFGRSASTLRETLERYRNSRPELFKAPLKLP